MKKSNVSQPGEAARRHGGSGQVPVVAMALLLCVGPLTGCAQSPSAKPVPESLERLNARLIDAAKVNRVETIKELLRSGASPDAYEVEPGGNDGGDTGLIIACRENNIEVARVLLAAGANPNLRQHGSPTEFAPLVVCADGGHDEIIRLLLDHGANVNIRVGLIPEMTALLGAAGGGHVGAATLLLLNGAIVDRRMLFQAISHGHVEIVERLMPAGADPWWTLETGRTVLEEAERSPVATRARMVQIVQFFRGQSRRSSK